MSDKKFGKYQIFQQLQPTQITSLSTATMAQSSNPTMRFAFKIPNTWIIDIVASNHIMGNKYILYDLSSSLSLPKVNLANGTTSSVDSVGIAKVTS